MCNKVNKTEKVTLILSMSITLLKRLEKAPIRYGMYNFQKLSVTTSLRCNNTRFPLLRFRSALHCGYSGITE
jgi:hypothetical protein